MARVKKIVENITVKNMMDEAIMAIEESIVIDTTDVIFLIIVTIANGKDGATGIVITEGIRKDIQEDIIIMTDKETSCFHSVKIQQTAPRVSHSDSIIDVPCYKCLVYIMCKQKVTNSVVNFANDHGCPDSKEFVLGADQNDINNMREVFGLGGYK